MRTGITPRVSPDYVNPKAQPIKSPPPPGTPAPNVDVVTADMIVDELHNLIGCGSLAPKRIADLVGQLNINRGISWVIEKNHDAITTLINAAKMLQQLRADARQTTLDGFRNLRDI